MEKSLSLGKIEDKRRRRLQKLRQLDSVTSLMDMHLGKLQEIAGDREYWHAAVLAVTKSWTGLSD